LVFAGLRRHGSASQRLPGWTTFGGPNRSARDLRHSRYCVVIWPSAHSRSRASPACSIPRSCLDSRFAMARISGSFRFSAPFATCRWRLGDGSSYRASVSPDIGMSCMLFIMPTWTAHIHRRDIALLSWYPASPCPVRLPTRSSRRYARGQPQSMLRYQPMLAKPAILFLMHSHRLYCDPRNRRRIVRVFRVRLRPFGFHARDRTIDAVTTNFIVWCHCRRPRSHYDKCTVDALRET
jgi:hypothetical protein